MSSEGLIVDNIEGVLFNDFDNGDGFGDVVLLDDVSNGDLILNNDGSFIYTPNSDYYEDDSFSYTLVNSLGDTVLNSNGNSFATVTIQNSILKIINFSMSKISGTLNPDYVKAGDQIQISFETTNESSVTNLSIAEDVIDINEVESTDSIHFIITYTILNSDNDGVIPVNIVVRDVLNNEDTYSELEVGLTIDNTKPIISFGEVVDDAEYKGEFTDFLTHPTVSDNYDHSVELIRKIYFRISGSDSFQVVDSMNANTVGSYRVVYSGFDVAGNQTEDLIIDFDIVDVTDEEFNVLYNDLLNIGINTNLNQVNLDDSILDNFFVEIIDNDGKIFGRITFINPIDFLNEQSGFFVDFILLELPERVFMSNGVISFNANQLTEDMLLFNSGAVITFYNLDKLGYTNQHTAEDIFNKLIIYDDNENLISNYITDYGVYTVCNLDNIICFSYSISISHFSKYVIGYADPIIIKKIEKNIVENSDTVQTLYVYIVESDNNQTKQSIAPETNFNSEISGGNYTVRKNIKTSGCNILLIFISSILVFVIAILCTFCVYKIIKKFYLDK